MNKLGRILSFCVLIMILLSFVSVSITFLFNKLFIPIQELIIYLHSTVFMLGIVYAFHYDKHVRIDIFYQKYSSNKQKSVNQLGAIFLLLPFFSFIIYSSFNYVVSSWSKFESSSEVGGLPFVFGLKSLILLMPFSMIVYALYKLVRNK